MPVVTTGSTSMMAAWVQSRLMTHGHGNVVPDGDFISDFRSQPQAQDVGPGTPGISATPPA